MRFSILRGRGEEKEAEEREAEKAEEVGEVEEKVVGKVVGKAVYTEEFVKVPMIHESLLHTSRAKMVARLVPEQEFRQAWEAGLSQREIGELFGVSEYDVRVLALGYGYLSRREAAKAKKAERQGAVRVVQHLPIDVNEIADRVSAKVYADVIAKIEKRIGYMADVLEGAARELRGDKGDR
jgi:hypothetical protein